jgi:NADPH:quinone reductase
VRAIRIEEYGSSDVLRDVDIEIPKPGPHEVQVRVRYAGVNFMDVHTRQGKYRTSTTYPVRIPVTLGMEGAGVVTELGSEVRDVEVGDRVAWCLAWGSYAEYATVPVAKLALVPEEISLELAAAALFQGATAHYLASDVAHLGPDTRCLVHAGAGAIGQLLIQFAKRAGATVFATASTAEKRALASAAGADATFEYAAGGFADAIRAATDGVGVDVVFDAVGRDTLRGSMRSTALRGLVVNYGSVSGSLQDIDPIELGEAGSLFLTRPRLADHMRDRAEVQGRADDIFRGLADGSLRINTAPNVSWDGLAAAHAALEERRQVGKAVLDISTA